jgi:DNA-binding YbaB/EbfC family protein
MFGDMGKLFRLAGQMKTKLPQLQEQLARSEYTAEVGGGAVVATVNGRLELVGIKIKPDALGTEEGRDFEMLEDLIKAGVAAAQQKAADAAGQAMKELTGGMDISDLGGMLP